MSDSKTPATTEDYILIQGTYGRQAKTPAGGARPDAERFRRGDKIKINAGEVKILGDRIAKQGTKEADAAIAWKKSRA